MMDAANIVRCIDLTSLTGQETDYDIVALCASAQTSLGPVAAICLYPQYLKIAKDHCPSGVKLATVINFPSGLASLDEVVTEVKAAIAAGAEELDVVIPYQAVLEGEMHSSIELIEVVKKTAGSRCVKAILESGVFEDVRLIFRISELLLVHGADFLKTSTGKGPVGATEAAVDAMLKALWQHARKSGDIKGLKVSGGVKTSEQALLYMHMAEEYFGVDYLMPKTFRVGASVLLKNILNID
jgi:deoxyribose-phosphate aldolase